MDRSQRAKSLFTVFFIFFLDNFGIGIVLPIFGPLLLGPESHFFASDMSLGMKNILYGVIFASFPLAQFFGAPILGDLADVMGRKFIFYVTIILTTLGYFFSGWAIWISSYTFLLISRIISGFFAGNLSLCLACIGDLSETEEMRGRNYGFISTLGGVSFVVAVFLAGFLSDSNVSKLFSPAIPFFVVGFLSILNIIVLWLWYTETFVVKVKKKICVTRIFTDIGTSLKDKEVAIVIVIGLMWFLSWFTGFQWFVPYIIKEFNTTNFENTLALSSLGVIWALSGCVLNHYLVKRFHSLFLVTWGTLLTIISTVFCGLASTLVLFVVFYLINCIWGAFSWANLNNLFSLSASEEEQGKIMGISQSMFSLGQVLASIPGAFLLAKRGDVIYFLSAFFGLIAVILCFYLKTFFKARSL